MASMQSSRDEDYQRPGVGTLMYMGEGDAPVPALSSPVARAAAGFLGALGVRHALKASARGRVGLVDGAVGIAGGLVLFRALVR